MAAFDLIIRNGTIVDGTTAPARRGDIGVRDGRIVEMDRVDGVATTDIDADGLVVAPGFIEGHTHMDAQVFWDELGTNSVWHGVTSAIMGNCGFTIAPSREGARDLVLANLVKAEDMPAEALAAGVDWSFETFPEYLDALDRLKKGINYGVYVGHSALRTWAMGNRAFEATANDDDMREMRSALQDALRAGAVGFSTSFSYEHETAFDQPVASRFATWDEVADLVRTAASVGDAIFEFASEGVLRDPDHTVPPDKAARVHELACQTGLRTTFSVSARREDAADQRAMFALLDGIAAAGGRVAGQVGNSAGGVYCSFRTQLPFDKIPEWRELRALPVDQQMVVLRDPDRRQALENAARHGDYGRAVGAEPRRPRYAEDFYVVLSPLGPNPTVGELANQRGVDPVTLIIDLALETNMDQFFFNCLGGFNTDLLTRGMFHPHTVLQGTDSGAHIGQIMGTEMFTRLFAEWVRDRQAITLERAVHMVTQRPAKMWGLAGRGALEVGNHADIVVFDLEKINLQPLSVAHDLPAGARRLVQKTEGFAATIINGEILLRDGEPTGNHPGRLLRASY